MDEDDYRARTREPPRSDDAGGGRRGTRPSISAELLRVLDRDFGLALARRDADLGGSANLNLLTRDGRGRLFVARVYRRSVTEARLTAIQAARRAVAAGGVPAMLAVPTAAGSAAARVGEHLVEAEPYVWSDAKMDDLPRLAAGLPLLGRVHALLAGVDLPAEAAAAPFANHSPAGAATAGVAPGTARIRAWGPSVAERRLADGADRLASEVAAAEQSAPPLHRQPVHGDYWDDNILFRGAEVVLVSDFDSMGVRPRVDDLALTLYYAGIMLLERGEADGAIAALRRLVRSYGSGLAQPLSAAERAAIPVAIARQPLWSFAVWIARLDDERAARAHAAGLQPHVDWALDVLGHLQRWRDAFA